MGGAIWEEQQRSAGQLPHPLGHGEPAELPGKSPALQSPLQATWVLGGIGGRLGRSGEAGRRSHPGGVGEEWRVFILPTRAREPAELQGWSPDLQGLPPQECIGPGGIGRRRRGEQERQVGGAL